MEVRYTDTQRMELRSYVSLAGDVIAKVWPMRTVIARNPLQGLEHLSFEEAVQRGEQLFGGSSTLSHDAFREAFQTGRIQARHLDIVLSPLAIDHKITFGGRVLSHLDVLRAAMVQGVQIVPPDDAPTAGASADKEDSAIVERITEWMHRTLPQEAGEAAKCGLPSGSEGWPYQETMATWCDRTLGTNIREQINRHMVKWCEAFCDEGDAAWSMPRREDTFFRAWKAAAQYDLSLGCLGIKQVSAKIRALADRPEDVLLESLEQLQIPHSVWQDYLSLHLAALPGWAGYIKWREEEGEHSWQEAFRIDLVKYLAVRLFYERELVATACLKTLHCEGTAGAIQGYVRQFPHAVWFRRASISGRLPKDMVSEAARHHRRWRPYHANEWEHLCQGWFQKYQPIQRAAAAAAQVRALMKMAKELDLPVTLVTSTQPDDLSALLGWLRRFSLRQQDFKWLEAFELAHQHKVLRQLDASVAATHSVPTKRRAAARPLAQFAFCIDVRSEVFRRHLEQCGGYETLGFAGFFGLPVSYRSLDEQHESALCPVLLKPKHLVREVPRTYQGARAVRRKQSRHLAEAGHELLQDLKHNVITPYVMVEALGWFFLVPFIGKTLCPRWYHRITARLQTMLMPAVATTLTVEKISTREAEDMLAAEQRLQIASWLRQRIPVAGSRVTAAVLEDIRHQALEIDQEPILACEALGRLLALSKTEEAAAIEELRRDCRLSSRGTRSRLDRITRTGFTLNEQAYYVETSLRLMGLTGSFARLVVLCGHGSTSQNNPYESSLDCGACGGGQGLPNARAFAMIANRPQVREILTRRGLAIPPDTHFVAALHDTTTDQVRVADLEDVPSTHRKDLAKILEDVHEAGAGAAAERLVALSESSSPAGLRGSRQQTERRSLDWAQVRPEWGLARNSVFIVGDRRLTQAADLHGRSFLHSYDHAEDTDGKLLETIMTAPLIVAQWISMEYYFSTVAPDVYGSGSKVYHNVTGRIGVMTGSQGDLRMGLPAQTVMSGRSHYHEPMRLTAIIHAPRDRIMAIIARQPLLEKLFNNGWMLLIACEPSEGRYYRYHGVAGWHVVTEIDDHVGDVATLRA